MTKFIVAVPPPADGPIHYRTPQGLWAVKAIRKALTPQPRRRPHAHPDSKRQRKARTRDLAVAQARQLKHSAWMPQLPVVHTWTDYFNPAAAYAAAVQGGYSAYC